MTLQRVSEYSLVWPLIMQMKSINFLILVMLVSVLDHVSCLYILKWNEIQCSSSFLIIYVH